MREEFEAWYSEFYTPQDASDIWQPIIKSMALKAWQASRQSLVVELPENGEPVFKNDFAEGVSSGADIYRSAVEYALDKQGIKHKCT